MPVVQPHRHVATVGHVHVDPNGDGGTTGERWRRDMLPAVIWRRQVEARERGGLNIAARKRSLECLLHVGEVVVDRREPVRPVPAQPRLSTYRDIATVDASVLHNV